MRPGVTRRHLLQGVLAGGLFGATPPPSPVGPPPPSPAPEPPLCRCRRTASCSFYCGAEPIVPTTLTYLCPRCGARVVEQGFRMAEACYPWAETGPGP